MKLLYFIPALFNPGGMERVLTQKVNYLSDELNYDISIVTTEQFSKPIYFELSKSIKLIHLDINFNNHYDLPLVFKFFQHKRKQVTYYNAVSKIVKSLHPDVLISLGGKEIEFLYKLDTKAAKICEMHFSMNVRRQFLGSRKQGILWDVVGYIRTYQLKKVTGKLDKLVVLTNQDKEQWTRTHDNVVCIANPSPFKINQNSYFVDSKTVISVGRLDAQKGYDKLVDAWSIVKKSCPDWKLNIFGSGELYEFLNRRISSLALENNVDLKGVSSHIEKEYLSASFFVMSSLFEGLPMVLIEAATFGLPIVSYDCEWGPREIVNNGLNGYLVPAGDIEMLAARIIELINNPGLRIQMSENAKEASKNYELSIIMNQWKDLFENLNK